MYERFIEKDHPPSEDEMREAIGAPLADSFFKLRRFLVETYAPDAFLQYGGKNYGWNIQHRKGGRPLCEVYPERGSFTAMVVLGKKEMAEADARLDGFGPTVRRYLQESPRFHDGCWMYMRFADPLTVEQDERDVEQLVLIKRKPPKPRAKTP